MNQPDDFKQKGKEHLVCKLRKVKNKKVKNTWSKQASRQWYLKFDEIICSYDFKENAINQWIYMKNSASKFIILVLYVNDILLACNDETKQILTVHFDTKDSSG